MCAGKISASVDGGMSGGSKYCPNHYSLSQLKVELGCLKIADTGTNIHTSAAMTHVDMSKIIFNPLFTILLSQPQLNLNSS
jgi:hypothetical protein